MQLQLVSTLSLGDLGVNAVSSGMALVLQGGVARLLYTPQDVNQALSLSLGSVSNPGSGYVLNQGIAPPVDWSSLQPNASMTFQDTGSGMRAFLYDSHSGTLTSTMLSSSGTPGSAHTVTTSIGSLSGVETFEIIGGPQGDCAAITKWNTAGVDLYHLASDGSMVFDSRIGDTAKSYVGNVSDTASVSIAGQDYLLTLSSLENGLTSYAIAADRSAAMIDTVGQHDGLYVSGPAALQVVNLAGLTYAIVAATGSSSLSVVRVNPLGCLFVTDHVVDDLTTRFAHTQVLDSFTWNDRAFVVSAGSDAGITIMELLPNGHLTPFHTVALETGAGLYGVTGLEVAVNGSTLQVFVVDAHADRVQTFEMSLATIGGSITAGSGQTNGSALGDLIMGNAESQSFSGAGGDDWLVSGGGADGFSGGSGADTFVLDESLQTSTIVDYEKHLDRIDLSDWGYLYSVTALTINATGTGATLIYGDHQLRLISADGHTLSAADFTETDFLF